MGNDVVAVPITVSLALVTTPGTSDEQRVVASRRRQRADDSSLSVSSRFALCTSMRRCFCGDRDRVGERADRERRIDGRRERSRELDAVSLKALKPASANRTGRFPAAGSRCGIGRCVGDGRADFSMSSGLLASTTTPATGAGRVDNDPAIAACAGTAVGMTTIETNKECFHRRLVA